MAEEMNTAESTLRDLYAIYIGNGMHVPHRTVDWVVNHLSHIHGNMATTDQAAFTAALDELTNPAA